MSLKLSQCAALISHATICHEALHCFLYVAIWNLSRAFSHITQVHFFCRDVKVLQSADFAVKIMHRHGLIARLDGYVVCYTRGGHFISRTGQQRYAPNLSGTRISCIPNQNFCTCSKTTKDGMLNFQAEATSSQRE